MYLCVWARNKTTVHHVGLRRKAKSNENCLWSTLKPMVACFFGKTDHVATVPLEQCCTINSEWYCNIYLEKFETTNHCSQWQCAFLTGQNVERWVAIAPNDYSLCVLNDFCQTPIFVQLVFTSHCKQYKCLIILSLPVKMPNCIWQHQKYARPETYVATLVLL